MPYYKAIARFSRKNKAGEIEASGREFVGWGTGPGAVSSELVRQVHDYEVLTSDITVTTKGPFQTHQDAEAS